MPIGKKKKSSAKKKSNTTKKENGNKKAPSLEELLSQAESALEMANIETALQLFEYSTHVLRERVHGNDGGNEGDKRTLASVLGKMGEIKASMGDVEGARTEFLDAIELLGSSAEGDKSAEEADKSMDEDKPMDVLDTIDISLSTAQHSEHLASLYLYLGQLSSCSEALTLFQTGVHELKKAVSVLEKLCNPKNGGKKKDDMDLDGEVMTSEKLSRYLEETRRQLCSAHCSIAELYLTDLCDEPDAENSCQKELESALKLDKISYEFYLTASKNYTHNSDENQLDPPPPDALQTMANLRMSQSKPKDALDCILKAYDRMKVGCEAMSALVGLGKDGEEVEAGNNAQELVEVDAASNLPCYEFRCQTAKLFLEIASTIKCEENADTSGDDNTAHKKCAESAIQILGSLMAENDEVIEVWYLLGCAFMVCSPPNVDSAHYYWDQCMTMLVKVKHDMEECIDDDDEDAAGELEAIDQQIDAVKKKLQDLDVKEDMHDC